MQGSDLILKTGDFAPRMTRSLSSFTMNELQQLGSQYNLCDAEELLRGAGLSLRGALGNQEKGLLPGWGRP